MKRIILLMLVLLAVSMISATRATGYGVSAPVTINTLLPPHDLMAEDMDESVILTWYAASIGTPDYFTVYGSNTPLDVGSFVVVGETVLTEFEDFDFIFSAYYVTSVYPLGESRPSNIAYASRMEPVRALVSIDSGANSAVLSWERSREAETYLLYYSDNPHAVFPAQWSGPISLDGIRFIDSLADKRFYKVFARVASRQATAPFLNSNPLKSKQ